MGITARNYGDDAVTLDVFFTDDDRDTLFSTRYELAGDTTNEAHGFDGDPAYVYVVVEESRTEITALDGSDCTDADAVDAWVVYGEDGTVSVDLLCPGG